MTKQKLFGTRLLKDTPRTPNVISLKESEDITNVQFIPGDIFDANSVKNLVQTVADKQSGDIEKTKEVIYCLSEEALEKSPTEEGLFVISDDTLWKSSKTESGAYEWKQIYESPEKDVIFLKETNVPGYGMLPVRYSWVADEFVSPEAAMIEKTSLKIYNVGEYLYENWRNSEYAISQLYNVIARILNDSAYANAVANDYFTNCAFVIHLVDGDRHWSVTYKPEMFSFGTNQAGVFDKNISDFTFIFTHIDGSQLNVAN